MSFDPTEPYQKALDRAATLWGIVPSFWDIFGTRHFTTPEIAKAILASMGVPVESTESIDRAVEERRFEDWSRLIPATLVIGNPVTAITLSVPKELAGGVVSWEISAENGARFVGRYRLAGSQPLEQVELRGRSFVRMLLPIAFDDLGYHKLRLKLENGAQSISAESVLIVCPDRAWFPEWLENGGKTAGLAVSLYGLKSDRNWGCGDFTDLEKLADWVKPGGDGGGLGASFIALNPLHAIANRMPYNTSPYLPACTYYRNFIYLDPERSEDFDGNARAASALKSKRVADEVAALRASEYVEYESVARLKLRFMKLLFRNFLGELRRNTRRATEFREYTLDQGRLLEQFAIYSALDESIHKRYPTTWIWPDWPEEYRDPESPAVMAFAKKHWRSVMFYQYLQWQVDLQIGAAQKYCREQGLKIGLYHDLALATDRCGSDLWAHRKFYAAGCRVGSPPDDFSPKGQDWSFPPPNTAAHNDDGYRLFRDSIRNNARHGGALRIDHVMRFFRLYWIPDGMEAANGAYVLDRPEDLLRILALESVRNKILVIGEDLGTVEPHVRETLARFGILSYKLLYFEKDEHGAFKRPRDYPAQSLVTSTTHDLPTLAGFWTNRDIEARRNAGLLPDDDSYRSQLAGRVNEKQKMLDALHLTGLLPPDYPRDATKIPELTGEMHNAVVGFLASTPSALLVLNQEDLTKETEQQNLPGSTAQYPNWRRKMKFKLEELSTSQEALGFTAMFRNWLIKTNRL
jgi:4-alpha-glucanotransferase